MPRIPGLEMLRAMPRAPLTILVTAFPNHALEGYDLDVVDYLIKPVPFDRFLAANKARELLALRATARHAAPADHFFIKGEGRYEKMAYADLLYAEAMQNYVVLHTTDRKLITYLTFKAV